MIEPLLCVWLGGARESSVMGAYCVHCSVGLEGRPVLYVYR